VDNWEQVKISPSSTIKEAVELLEKVRLGIVLVTDEERKLMGTVTDGDIRRGLIDHVTLDDQVSEIMTRNPAVASISDDRAKIREMMTNHDLLQIPITDSDRRLVGLEVLQPLARDRAKYENPVVLMAGGFGKRLHPITLKTPKPLLRLGSKPISQLILEQLIEAGFQNFFLTVHYKADQVKRYFGDGKKWNVAIRYIEEERPLGTAGALGLLPSDLPDLPILVMNSDLLTKVNFQQLLHYHQMQEGSATVCARGYDFQVPYGVIETVDQKVSGIVEKPEHKFLVNAGIYVLNTEIVTSISRGSYLDMPDVLLQQLESNNTVNIFPVHEYWLDIGKVDEFERAQEEVERDVRERSKKRRNMFYDAIILVGLLILIISASADFIGLGAGPNKDVGEIYGPLQIIGNLVGVVVTAVGIVMKRSLR